MSNTYHGEVCTAPSVDTELTIHGVHRSIAAHAEAGLVKIIGRGPDGVRFVVPCAT